MDDPLIGVIGGLCVVSVVLVAVIALFGGRRRRRRQDQLWLWADSHGWTFDSHLDVDWGRQLPGGNKHGVRDVFSKVLDGRRVSVAEYSVTDASDGTTTNTHYYVVTTTMLSHPFPSTQLQRRGNASRLKSRLVGPGESATGNAEFDRAFRLHAADPAIPKQWFTSALIAAHISGRTPVPWSVRGAELICHQPGRLDLNNIPRHAAAVLVLADLLM